MLFVFKKNLRSYFIFSALFLMCSTCMVSWAEEKAAESEPQSKITSGELIKSGEEMDRLEAEIARQQAEYNIRPRRKFVGARTDDAQVALYMEKWRKRVECAGNLNYPQEARDKQIYGKVRVTVSINYTGELLSVEINKSSGEKILDDAVVAAVNKAAPFEPFEASMKEKVDILIISRTFNYIHEDASMTEDCVLTEIKKQTNGK